MVNDLNDVRWTLLDLFLTVRLVIEDKGVMYDDVTWVRPSEINEPKPNVMSILLSYDNFIQYISHSYNTI